MQRPYNSATEPVCHQSQRGAYAALFFAIFAITPPPVSGYSSENK
jgi:hypothetical protein